MAIVIPNGMIGHTVFLIPRRELDKDEKWREKLLIDFIIEDKISKQLIIYDVTFNKKN